MSRPTAMCALTFAMCLTGWAAGNAPADAIVFGSRDLAVYAGGGINMGKNVWIAGNVGSAGYIGLEKNGSVSGGMFGRQYIDIGQNGTIGGRIIAEDGLGLGKNASTGAIDSGQGIDFSQGVQTGAVRARGYVGVAKNMTVHGDLSVGGWLDIQQNATVHGDVYHRQGYGKHNSATVDGEFIDIDQKPVIDDWTYQAPDFPSPSSSVSDYRWYGSGEEVYLDPGDYGYLDFGNDVVIHLTAPGEYNFDSLNIGHGGQVLADTPGVTVLNVEDGLEFGNDVQMLSDPDLVCMDLRVGGWATFGNDNTLQADILALDDGVEIGQNSTVSGVIYADGYADLGQGVSVLAQAYHTPEPTSLFVILIGGAVGVVLDRRGGLANR